MFWLLDEKKDIVINASRIRQSLQVKQKGFINVY